MSTLPTGTATFVFTDIEGSTRILQEQGERWRELLAFQERIIRSATDAHGGHEIGTEGDAFFIVFRTAAEAVAACVDAQRALQATTWPEGARIRVRMGVHTGEANVVGDNYVGLDVHRAARISNAAHGEQVLVSASVRTLAERSLPEGVVLRDLGEHRLKDLAQSEHLYQLDISGLRTEFPPVRSLKNTPNNLPLQATSFVGRREELKTARELLARSRLLTLTGAGGTGKTRLALQVAAESADAYPQGVFFVRLAPISDPELVPSTVAASLGLPESSAAVEARVVEHLRGKHLLMLLDNFEQILDAAPFVGRLLSELADLRVLVTSRAPLRVYGEQEYPVPPLAIPQGAWADPETLSQYDAVRLFIERAATAKPGFAITNENAPAVAEICSRLDGLPLAIELAAARIRLLTPQAMLPRLEHALETLSVGSRDLPERQQTLRAAISWSYDLLDEPSRLVFARFSTFRGGADLEDAEAVCGSPAEDGGDVLGALETLVEHSVLRQSETAGEPRFWMLVVIREFAAEKLAQSGEAEVIRDRHAERYCALARAAEAQLTGHDQKRWLDRLDLDRDNLRSALDWLEEKGDGPTAMRMGAALWRFWQIRGHLNEGRRRMEAILALPSPDEEIAVRAKAHEAAGSLAYWQADTAAATRHYLRSLELWEQQGDRREIANALYNSAFPDTILSLDLDNVRKGMIRIEQALAVYRELDDQAGVAKTLWGLAAAHQFLGEHELAERENTEALEIAGRHRDPFGAGWNHHMRGTNYVRMNKLEEAKNDFVAALEVFSGAGDISGVVMVLDDFARLAALRGDAERAIRISGARSALQTSAGIELADRAAEWMPRPSLDLLPPDVAQRVYAEGQAMDQQRAIAYAMETA